MSTVLTWNPQITALVNDATDAIVQAVADELYSNVKANYSLMHHPIGTPSPAAAHQPPAMVTGNLEAHTQQQKVGPRDIVVFNDAVYARIHEFGGIIYATKSKALTIPLGLLGIRFLAIVATAGWQWAIHAYGAWTTKAGIVCAKIGGVIVPLVALRPFVIIPIRPAWQPAIAETKANYASLAATIWRRYFP